MSVYAQQILRRAVIAARSIPVPATPPHSTIEVIRPRSRPAYFMKAATFEYVLGVVCDESLIPREDILSTRGAPKIALVRQMAIYLCHTFAGWSQASVGRQFDRDPSSANHACKKIKRMIAVDPDFAARIAAIRRTLEA